MNYTYQWCDEEQTSLKRTDADGSVAWVPTDSGNRDYAAFLSSAATAEAYVAPPEPEPLTTEQKIEAAGFDPGELTEYLVSNIKARLND